MPIEHPVAPRRIAREAFGLSRYDAVLLAIPVAFATAVLVGSVLSVPTRSAVAVASLTATAVLADALFFNPPRGPGSGRDAT